MDRLKDKVAIVTGSTSGIGTGIAKMFGAEGERVVVCGRNEERGAAVVDAIAEAGGTAWFHKLDITQPETVDALFADTKEKWGSIDVLVNNAAGMALKDGRVDEISLEDWDAVFASDVRSTFYCTKTVLPFMQEQGAGSIINIGSVGGLYPDLSRTAYGVSKAAIHFLTKDIAVQYARQGVRCNAVLPGFTATDAALNNMSQAFLDLFLKNVPLNRPGRPEDIADAVAFLASDRAAFITGEILPVAGGFGLPTPLYGSYMSAGAKG